MYYSMDEVGAILIFRVQMSAFCAIAREGWSENDTGIEGNSALWEGVERL